MKNYEANHNKIVEGLKKQHKDYHIQKREINYLKELLNSKPFTMELCRKFSKGNVIPLSKYNQLQNTLYYYEQEIQKINNLLYNNGIEQESVNMMHEKMKEELEKDKEKIKK